MLIIIMISYLVYLSFVVPLFTLLFSERIDCIMATLDEEVVHQRQSLFLLLLLLRDNGPSSHSPSIHPSVRVYNCGN